jgi:hypothetical protein
LKSAFVLFYTVALLLLLLSLKKKKKKKSFQIFTKWMMQSTGGSVDLGEIYKKLLSCLLTM